MKRTHVGGRRCYLPTGQRPTSLCGWRNRSKSCTPLELLQLIVTEPPTSNEWSGDAVLNHPSGLARGSNPIARGRLVHHPSRIETTQSRRGARQWKAYDRTRRIRKKREAVHRPAGKILTSAVRACPCRCGTGRSGTLSRRSSRATFGTVAGARSVTRRIKDIFEISEYTPLDDLIERLRTIHASLSDDSSPIVAIRGDDFFGQRLTITYLRELTKEEAAIEKRYSAARRRKRSSASAPSSTHCRHLTANGQSSSGEVGVR